MKPVAECPDGAVISVLPIPAIKARQELIDVGGCEIIVGDEPS